MALDTPVLPRESKHTEGKVGGWWGGGACLPVSEVPIWPGIHEASSGEQTSDLYTQRAPASNLRDGLKCGCLGPIPRELLKGYSNAQPGTSSVAGIALSGVKWTRVNAGAALTLWADQAKGHSLCTELAPSGPKGMSVCRTNELILLLKARDGHV